MAADPTGRRNGRGAYLCRRAQCWEKGLVKRALERRLRGPVSGDDLETLKRYFIDIVASGAYAAAADTAGGVADGA